MRLLEEVVTCHKVEQATKKPRAGKTVFACLIVALFLCFAGCSCRNDNNSGYQTRQAIHDSDQRAEASSYNAKALHRLDFRVVGKSCAVCLMGIQSKFKSMIGVVKAAVMLKKPYGAVVIYDSSKVNMQALLTKARNQDKEGEDRTDYRFPIQKIPTILIRFVWHSKNCPGHSSFRRRQKIARSR